MAVDVGKGYREVTCYERVFDTDERSWRSEITGELGEWLAVGQSIPSATLCDCLGGFRRDWDGPQLVVRRRIDAPQNPSTSEQVRGNQSILAEADQIAGESRSRDYGHPYDNHERIAGGWNIQLAKKLKEPITPREAALMMVWLKLARECNTEKRDNLIDIAGYVKCADMIDQRQKELRCESDS